VSDLFRFALLCFHLTSVNWLQRTSGGGTQISPGRIQGLPMSEGVDALTCIPEFARSFLGYNVRPGNPAFIPI
jgi:hypothetical protein